MRELSWLRAARLKRGPPVSLIDLSAGGALLETTFQMQPGSGLVLEVARRGEDASVPLRVLRCHVAALDRGTIYRSACVFDAPLEWPDLIPRLAIPASLPPRDFGRLDVALKRSVDQYMAAGASKSPCEADQMVSGGESDIIEILSSLHAETIRRQSDPLGRGLSELLGDFLPALRRGDSPPVVLAAVEERLRGALPLVTIRLGDQPLPCRTAGSESIYFDVSAVGAAASEVLEVEFPSGYGLNESQFRLLKASTYLITLLLDARRKRTPECSEREAAGPGPASRLAELSQPSGAATAPSGGSAHLAAGWNKLVVRYLEGELLKGFSHDFHPSRPQFSLWPSSEAKTSERLIVPLSRVKAVFFVRDFVGDASYVEQKTFEHSSSGRRLEVTFLDGEVVLGSTLSYRPDGNGFFMFPADPRANNVRIFVLSSAVRHVQFV